MRNIEYSYPYMHDGRFNTLAEVINHYTSDITKKSGLASELQNEINLNSNQKVDLLSFLLTLSDESFIFDRSIGYPKYFFEINRRNK